MLQVIANANKAANKFRGANQKFWLYGQTGLLVKTNMQDSAKRQ
jgi:hypothetical protein